MYPKKSLGQNFLTDESIAQKIVEAGEISKDDNVLEIGPGLGFLTKELIRNAREVLAVEKDEELVRYCQNNLPQKNLEVLEGDVLKVDWKANLTQRNFFPFKLIANIPYYITGKILRLFLENSFQPEVLVLMVQKEVAERVCQKSGKHSILSLSVQYFGDPEIVMIVPREKFDPVPEVDSAVLKIVVENKNRLDTEEKKKFFRIIKIGFASPRKTLVNNLSAGLQKNKKEVEKILKELGFKETVRAQELSLGDWKKLMNFL